MQNQRFHVVHELFGRGDFALVQAFEDLPVIRGRQIGLDELAKLRGVGLQEGRGNREEAFKPRVFQGIALTVFEVMEIGAGMDADGFVLHRGIEILEQPSVSHGLLGRVDGVPDAVPRDEGVQILDVVRCSNQGHVLERPLLQFDDHEVSHAFFVVSRKHEVDAAFVGGEDHVFDRAIEVLVDSPFAEYVGDTA